MAKDDPIPVDDQSLFFCQVVDSSPELLHTARPDGYLDFFNQTWLDFTGVPLDRLLGWGWTSRIHPDDVEAFVQKMRESFAKGRPFQETSRIRRVDGVCRWMLHHKVASLLRTDEEFVLYGGEHSNQPGSSSVLLVAPASMQPALETYQRSVVCAVPDDCSSLRAAYG